MLERVIKRLLVLFTYERLSLQYDNDLFLKPQKAGIYGKIYQVIKSLYHGSKYKVKCHQLMLDSIDIT